MGLSEQDVTAIAERCRTLPPARGIYVQRDYVTNLFLAVLDYSSTADNVRKALRTYKERHWSKIRTIEDLKHFLGQYPDTPEGNLQAGSNLWGFKAARRVQELRNLVKYFETRGVTTGALLTHWAQASHYRDFMGRVKGLGLEVYEGMQIRQGYGPIKPGTHLVSFVSATLGHPVTDQDLPEAVDRASARLGLSPRELDRRIYENELTPSRR
ncbi:MAG: hypothetical protein ACT4OM_01005 [Actinomycetota bacterium]